MSEGIRLEAQGHLEKALTAYVSEKHWDGAVRVAMSLNRHLDAAKFCLQAGRPWDAAVCFQRANAPRECLQALLQVTPQNTRYRDACVHAIRVAQTLQMPLDTMSAFFMPFLSRVPGNPAEAGALKELAEAFVTGGKLRLAISIYRSVLQAYPNDLDAPERLTELVAIEKTNSSSSSSSFPAVATPSPGPFQSSGSGAFTKSSASGSIAGKTPPAVSSHSGLMRALRPKLSEILVQRGVIDQPKVDKLFRDQPGTKNSESAFIEAIVTAEWLKAEDVLRIQSETSGIPFATDEELIFNSTPEAAKALTSELAEKLKVAPMRLLDRTLTVGMQDPRDMTLIDKLRFGTGLKIVGMFATADAIRRTNGRHYRGEDPNETGTEAWQGKMLDPALGTLEPYSDRYTGTREHQFETGEFERTAESSAPVVKRAPTTEMQAPPKVGTKFARRYQLEALIGEGGSASVFRALDLELNEPVAIKIFTPATASEAETMVARFKLELSLSRLLSHPNIVRLFDLGSEGPWRYLTMELLEGKDLASLMNERGRALPVEEGLRYLEQACIGLQCAHERGVVHRDIKPHNLFVTTKGEVKVMDFGIARKLNTPGVTMMGTIAGTPEYMSPEQINGFSDVNSSTDLYALGVTAYQVFTGALPFNYAELTRLLIAQASEAPPSPRSKNPQLPEALEAVLLKCLEKDPAKRPGNAAVLSMSLRAIREAL
jgi:serine/threonine-protein kinase